MSQLKILKKNEGSEVGFESTFLNRRQIQRSITRTSPLLSSFHKIESGPFWISGWRIGNAKDPYKRMRRNRSFPTFWTKKRRKKSTFENNYKEEPKILSTVYEKLAGLYGQRGNKEDKAKKKPDPEVASQKVFKEESKRLSNV